MSSSNDKIALASHSQVTDKLDKKAMDTIFDIKAYTKHVDKILKRALT